MFLYVFKGEDFPPAKVEGDCNPMLKFNCFGNTTESTAKTGTFNPFWAETIHMRNVNMQDIFVTNLTKGLVVEAFDYIDDSHDQFIGSFLIQINSKNLIKYRPTEKDIAWAEKEKASKPQETEFIYIKPRWHYITNPHIEIGKHIFGRVLLGVALFRQDDLKKQKIPLYIYDFNYRERENPKRKDN